MNRANRAGNQLFGNSEQFDKSAPDNRRESVSHRSPPQRPRKEAVSLLQDGSSDRLGAISRPISITLASMSDWQAEIRTCQSLFINLLNIYYLTTPV